MNAGIYKWLNIKYPQNYLFRNPFQGSLIISLVCFGFLVLYKPLNTHASKALSYEATMAIYSFLSGIIIFLSIVLLKTVRCLSNSKDWTIFKELFSVFFVLFSFGVAIYLLGFFMETSGNRWNISTFLDSVRGAFLIGIIPLAFFTLINYRYLFPERSDYDEGNIAKAGDECNATVSGSTRPVCPRSLHRPRYV